MDQGLKLKFYTTLSDLELEKLANIYIECFNDPEKGENWTQGSALKYFKERQEESSSLWCIEQGKQIIACVLGSPYKNCFLYKDFPEFNDNSFYISLVAVSKKHRKNKCAQKLMSEMINQLKSNYSSLLVRCRLENIAVQNLFLQFNFKQKHLYSSILGGVECERIILKKPL